MRITQKTIILRELRKGGYFSLGDSLNLRPKPIYALSQRIGELKKMGYQIESRRKEGTPYDEYKLTGEPEKPKIIFEGDKAIMVYPEGAY